MIVYDIFVPIVNANGVLYRSVIAEEAKAKIIAFFGGLTDTRHRNEGIWKIGKTVVRDEIVIWRVVSDHGIQGDEFIRELKKFLESGFDQDKVLITKSSVEVF